MAFSNFKNIADVQQKYNIKYQEDDFIVAEDITPPEVFLQDFNFYKENIDIFTSEASRSEIIISPLLREIYKQHYQKYSFWIQKSINYDNILSGTPDYILSKKSELGKTVLENPIIIIVEAKKNDFEQGWGQCLAELVASQKLNKNSNKPVYGIVTDGNLWQFGKLLENTFTQDRENFTIDKLPRLYGALAYIFQLVESDHKN
ncbi:hypothetical protein [Crocosphaera sp. XPORK-15E]|uniref:hypothetical protein n=1 Tax=Crocosphaera sp. XPORK-15E TaxID=3110247 RepID=UPI002B1EF40A|nr:hypothetical protein [Crocosphaera sp. XPORK-15E]MEA5535839.1 hypothetical protein [Crocosphaera sp. XPORK-15E]